MANRLNQSPEAAEDRLHCRYRVYVECDCCGYIVPTPYTYPIQHMSDTPENLAVWWSKQYHGGYVQLWHDGLIIASAGEMQY